MAVTITILSVALTGMPLKCSTVKLKGEKLDKRFWIMNLGSILFILIFHDYIHDCLTIVVDHGYAIYITKMLHMFPDYILGLFRAVGSLGNTCTNMTMNRFDMKIPSVLNPDPNDTAQGNTGGSGINNNSSATSSSQQPGNNGGSNNAATASSFQQPGNNVNTGTQVLGGAVNLVPLIINQLITTNNMDQTRKLDRLAWHFLPRDFPTHPYRLGTRPSSLPEGGYALIGGEFIRPRHHPDRQPLLGRIRFIFFDTNFTNPNHRRVMGDVLEQLRLGGIREVSINQFVYPNDFTIIANSAGSYNGSGVVQITLQRISALRR